MAEMFALYLFANLSCFAANSTPVKAFIESFNYPDSDAETLVRFFIGISKYFKPLGYSLPTPS